MDAHKIAEELELIGEALDAFADQDEELAVIDSVAIDLLDVLEIDAPDATIIRNQVDTLSIRYRVTKDDLQSRKAQLNRHNQHLVPFRYCIPHNTMSPLDSQVNTALYCL